MLQRMQLLSPDSSSLPTNIPSLIASYQQVRTIVDLPQAGLVNPMAITYSATAMYRLLTATPAGGYVDSESLSGNCWLVAEECLGLFRRVSRVAVRAENAAGYQVFYAANICKRCRQLGLHHRMQEVPGSFLCTVGDIPLPCAGGTPAAAPASISVAASPSAGSSSDAPSTSSKADGSLSVSSVGGSSPGVVGTASLSGTVQLPGMGEAGVLSGNSCPTNTSSWNYEIPVGVKRPADNVTLAFMTVRPLFVLHLSPAACCSLPLCTTSPAAPPRCPRHGDSAA